MNEDRISDKCMYNSDTGTCPGQIDDNFNSNEALNTRFTYDEIKATIGKLKNNKAPGIDHLRNEFLRNSSQDLVNFFCRLFNYILDSGFIPEIWCQGIIMPIYKKKGDPHDPNNYRGISLLSCMGKLFMHVLVHVYLNSWMKIIN